MRMFRGTLTPLLSAEVWHGALGRSVAAARFSGGRFA